MSSPTDSSETIKRSYRPVIIVHGLMTGDVSTMQSLASRIVELHPGTKMYVFKRYCGLASLEPLWRQTKQLADDLLYVCSLHPEGVHIIGYSQGGLLVRGMLQMCGSVHNVKTFVSLSSPQGGQYGAECFTKMFPALTTRTAYEVFYTRLGQHALSLANYWYDPRHRDLYLQYSLYLAVIDNANQAAGDNFPQKLKKKIKKMGGRTVIQTNNDFLIPMETRVSKGIAAVTTATEKVAEGHYDDDDDNKQCAIDIDAIMANVSDSDVDYYDLDDSNSNVRIGKLGLTRLQRLVLIGGPDDGVISPWQSSQFGVLDSAGEVVPLRERRQDDIFSDDDRIGLRQLDVTGRIVEYTVPGVGHHEWHCNEQVLKECIIDWLD